MRTKVLICAAALAASIASSLAQNVYSLNVVGYVNQTLVAGKYTLVANPLDGTMGNTVANGNNVSNLFLNPPANTTIYPFNSATAQFGTPASFTVGKGGGAWTGTFDLPPGQGVFFNNPATTNMVVTFVGQVIQGPYTVATLGAGRNVMVGSPVPIGGDLTNSIVGLAPVNGDSISTFNSASAQWNSPISVFTVGKGGGAWSANLQIAPAQGFLYYNPGAAKTLVSAFTVQ